MQEILFAVAIIAGIGGVAGVGLSILSVVMAVPSDPKVDALIDTLPGANCGACGYSGCQGYAEAMAAGGVEANLCLPGGTDVARAVAAILGTKADPLQRKVGLVRCQGSRDNAKEIIEYGGIESCAAVSNLAGALTGCRYGCIGLGDCVRVCSYGAIQIVNGVAWVNPVLCRACNRCVAVCPKQIIAVVPDASHAQVLCASCDNGAVTNKACAVGCIACRQCVKACPEGAITLDGFLATVDPALCTSCGLCVTVCPKKTIAMHLPVAAC